MTSADEAAVHAARIVLTTEADRSMADRLASVLIEARVAACVTMHPVRSVYRWQGSIHDGDEVQLVIKTTQGAVEDLIAVMVEHHTYEVPEILVLEAGAGGRYAAWIRDEVFG